MNFNTIQMFSDKTNIGEGLGTNIVCHVLSCDIPLYNSPAALDT